MSYTNFQVGEKFPLPIQAAGDGGLFQIDANGMMFILQLSNTDVIATEAFRTGKMELLSTRKTVCCSSSIRSTASSRPAGGMRRWLCTGCRRSCSRTRRS